MTLVPPDSTRVLMVPDLGARAGVALRMVVPDSWVCSPLVGGATAIHPPAAGAGDAAAWTHAVVAVTRAPVDLGVADIAEVNLDRLRRHHPDLVVRHQRTFRAVRRTVHLRAVTIAQGSADATPQALAQVHGLVLPDAPEGSGAVDLVSVVGTCAEDAAVEYVPSFLALMASIEVLGDGETPELGGGPAVEWGTRG